MLRRVSRCAQLALLAGAVLTLLGCGSSSGPTIPKSAIGKTVLQRSDLPKGFAAFYLGPQVAADQTPARSDPSRFGRAGGWIARYRRNGSAKTVGPLVVSSRADVFRDTGGAKRDFAIYRGELTRPGTTQIDVGKLGAEAVGVTTVQPGTLSIRSYSIAWREANATAELDLNGFVRKLTLANALALARKQEARLRNSAR